MTNLEISDTRERSMENDNNDENIRKLMKQYQIKSGSVIRVVSQASNVYEGEVNNFNESDGTLLLKNVSAFNTTDEMGIKKHPQKFHQITLWISKLRDLRLIQQRNDRKEISDDNAVSSAIIKKIGDVPRVEKQKEWSPNPQYRKSPFQERRSFNRFAQSSTRMVPNRDRPQFDRYFYNNMMRSGMGRGFYNNNMTDSYRNSMPQFSSMSNRGPAYSRSSQNYMDEGPQNYRMSQPYYEPTGQYHEGRRSMRNSGGFREDHNPFRSSYNRRSNGFETGHMDLQEKFSGRNSNQFNGYNRRYQKNCGRRNSNRRESKGRPQQLNRSASINAEDSDMNLSLEEVSKVTDSFITKELQELSLAPKSESETNVLGDSVYYNHETCFFDELSRPSGHEKIDRKEERKKNLETFQGLNFGYRTKSKTGYVTRDLLETVSQKAIF